MGHWVWGLTADHSQLLILARHLFHGSVDFPIFLLVAKQASKLALKF